VIAEIGERGLRTTTKKTGLDRPTIRGIPKGKRVKASTLVEVVIGLGSQQVDLVRAAQKMSLFSKVASEALIKGYCIDRLSRHDLSGLSRVRLR
jgi:hypothetical protein